ncbi:cytochrome b561 [Phyllobacterium sp. YR620]|uniref:cytochrome b n=1 Tax=Phyllobacterium sp. YR620 TaxID=1881066 RepID=UPI0008874BCA|nr:cytochrome b [Phyllobacterium sp. YR620]SDP06841.1 cytochrome b561 [Phyllobacterium sp. YR620]
MSKKSDSTTFSLPQRVLHWLAAALIFFNLLLPDGMTEWDRSVKKTGMASADQISSANIHAYVGILILGLVILRLALRFIRGVPASPTREPEIFKVASKFAHAALYFVLFAMPVTGMAAYYLGYNEAGDVHADILKVILWALIGMHVLGVLVHQFYWKTNVLRRMVFGEPEISDRSRP